MGLNTFESNIKNIKGTFAIEGMSLSDETIKNLEKIADKRLDGYDIIEDLKKKYKQRA